MENLDVLRQVYNECVKGLQYIAEPPTLDYWQTPKETEQKQGGDCEDLAIWCAKHGKGVKVLQSYFWYGG